MFIGWLCGRLKLIDREAHVTDCTSLNSMHGLPITREWLDMAACKSVNHLKIESDAECLLVIEKEAIYTRLNEDKFFDRTKCIIICGKGFPDLATRACLFVLHRSLQLPVYGLCDCNPYGVSVLMTYFKGSKKLGIETDMYSVPIQWLGLRPSQIDSLNDGLPKEVFQSLTDLDRRRLYTLMEETCAFTNLHDERQKELISMNNGGFKLEIESLQWFGLDFVTKWLQERLEKDDSI